jgi:hypothetical protein
MYLMYLLLGYKEGDVTQAVIRGPLTAETWVRSWAELCGICSGRSGTGTGCFSLS